MSENLFLSKVILRRFKAAFKPNPIELTPFTVVIGRNGSGKSTLVEALQWVDMTLRRDAREASDRYFGVTDLVNLRSHTRGTPYFELVLEWHPYSLSEGIKYKLKVEDSGQGVPRIAEENLVRVTAGGRAEGDPLVSSRGNGERVIHPRSGSMTEGYIHRDPDRLVLDRVAADWSDDPLLSQLVDFWSRAVFLRLSPNRLVQGSPATRKSFEPLLDEEGQTLPALLNELHGEHKEWLVSNLRGMLEGIRGVEVARSEAGRDQRVTYSLTERMPYRGRTGRYQFPIPAWMLSEGTRRITALLALLARHSAPSLLCVEELENGLDPWTALKVLRHLRDASDRGTQVIVTTHSPWLLDHVRIADILLVERKEGHTVYERFANRDAIRAFADGVPPGTRYVNEDS